MIRDVNFFGGEWGGGGAKGAGTWWCHFGYPNNLAGPILAKRCSICWGSCSICLLMSTVVGGTHVYHVMRLAGSTFTWRSDHRGKWQPPWQMFPRYWGGSHGRAVQSEGPDISAANNCRNMCPPRCTSGTHRKARSQLFFFKTKQKRQAPLTTQSFRYLKCVYDDVLFPGVWFRGRSLRCHRMDGWGEVITSQHDNST